MKISIVIPAYNEEKLLASTLAAVARASAPFQARGWAVETIVCDNNSSDRTGAIARENGAVVVFEPVNQIARARNAGASAATGDWIIFIDADSAPSAELLEDAAQAMTSGRYLAGGATVKLDEDLFIASRVTAAWNLASRILRLAAGSFIFCEMRLFREIGGFSHDLFVSEELEFFKRVKKAAKARGRRVVILSRHPLVTSARKARLYSLREHAVFFAKSILSGGKVFRKRSACPVWYDGRR